MILTNKKDIMKLVTTASHAQMTETELDQKQKRLSKRILETVQKPYNVTLNAIFNKLMTTKNGRNQLGDIPENLEIGIHNGTNGQASAVFNYVGFPGQDVIMGGEKALMEMMSHEFEHLRQFKMGMDYGERAGCNPTQVFTQAMLGEATAFIVGQKPIIETELNVFFGLVSPESSFNLRESTSLRHFSELVDPKNSVMGQQWRRAYEKQMLLSTVGTTLNNAYNMTVGGNATYHRAVVERTKDVFPMRFHGYLDMKKLARTSTWLLNDDNKKMLTEINEGFRVLKKHNDRTPLSDIAIKLKCQLFR